MATYVWFVPGFMGSTLGQYQTNAGGGPPTKIATLWGNLEQIVNANLLTRLTLPSTLPPGQFIQADGVAPSVVGGYTNFLQNLQNALPSAWLVVPWPFDWRQPANVLGQALAALLLASKNQGNTNYIVAHSQGALVAWCAWASLVDQGQTSACQKFVTFAGALYGTTSTPNIFREQEGALDTLLLLQRVVSGIFAFSPLAWLTPAGAAPPQTAAQLISAVATWPGLYDLYPDVNKLDDPGDTNRSALYLPANWEAALVQPNFTLLNQEATNLQSWLRVPKYLPPQETTSHIVCTGQQTPYRVQLSQGTIPIVFPGERAANSAQQARLAQLPWFTGILNGDDRCTNQQQFFPGYYYQTAVSAHASAQDNEAVLDLIVRQLLLQTAVPPPPPPLSFTPANTPQPPPASSTPWIFNNDPIVITPPPQVPRGAGFGGSGEGGQRQVVGGDP